MYQHVAQSPSSSDLDNTPKALLDVNANSDISDTEVQSTLGSLQKDNAPPNS